MASLASSTPPLTVLTYNIWFEGGFNKPAPLDPVAVDPNTLGAVARGKYLLKIDTAERAASFVSRMSRVVNILRASQADVVCLQEVTPWSREIFASDPFLTEIYAFSENPLGRYGVLILAKKERAPSFQTHAMETMMGRDLVGVVVDLPSGGAPKRKVLVLTAHFESLSAAPIRKLQLEQAASVMNEKSLSDGVLRNMMSFFSGATPKHPNTVLCGDFNFCSYRNFDKDSMPLENDVLRAILPDHDDLWPTLVWPGEAESDGTTTPRAEDKGYTFDSELNHNIRQTERMRYDRVLSRCSDLIPRTIRLVGTEEMEGEGGNKYPMHPSDHFGLLATFGFRV